jgi:SlyX protein
MEDRLINLESKLAFAEHTLEELNATVYRQQQQIDLLQEQLRLLYQQMQAGSAAEKSASSQEVPPHY